MSKLGPTAKSILEEGRAGDDPTPADRARVKRALMRSIAAGGALGATSTAGAAAKGASLIGAAGQAASIGLGAKVLGVALLVGAVGAGVALRASGTADRAPMAPASSYAASSNASPVDATRGNAARGNPSSTSAAPSEADPSIVEPPGGLLVNGTPAEGRILEGAPASKGIGADKAAPNHANPIGDAPMGLAPAKGDEPAALDRPHASPVAARALPRPATTAPVGPSQRAGSGAMEAPPEDPLAAETRRLREAHGALQAGDPERALTLLNEPEGGQLGEERAAARVLALCTLGRTGEAEAAQSAFFRSYPRSPLESRVRNGCSNLRSK